MPWNPDLYHKFRDERVAPFYDLLALVNKLEGLDVVDLGCGTGELTAELAQALPNSRTLGIDNSPEMLERAQSYARPNLQFTLASIDEISGTWDLIFSNAALQWVDNHNRLIPRLMNLLRPGGQIVVQVPSNSAHPAQSIVREIAAEEPFRGALKGFVRNSPVLPIDSYAELLYTHGGRSLEVFEKIYPHILPDSDAMAEFTSGTVLIPYMERLEQGLKESFKALYKKRLQQLYPSSPLLYTFRRTFFSALLP